MTHDASSRARVVSLDAFRGLTIAGMILVNNPGSWAYVYAPLRHAEWHGWTPTDLIFPFFLFILGVAVPFSFARRLGEGADRRRLLLHVLRRAVVLLALGFLLRIFPDFHVRGIRWPGVLQRIALVYLMAASLYLHAGPRARAAWTAFLLVGYWIAMTTVPVPGYGAGDLGPEGNVAAWLDRMLMAGHLYQGTWDPEGLLSTLPAVATSLLGIHTGEWLRSGRSPMRLAGGMAAAGVILLAAGWAWGVVFPINKNLWTSSYVLFTAGWALIVLTPLYVALDVRGARGRWHVPLVVYGTNAIAVYVLSGLVTKLLIRIRVGGAGGSTLYTWLWEEVFRSWAGPMNGSLAFAGAYVLLWLAAMWPLYRRRIFIRV